MTRILYIAAFLVGLAVVGWIGAGYVGSNPLALAVTALVGVAYLAGTWELRRYHQATGTLSRALAGLSDVPASLAGWLDQLHPSLRSPARLRIEGDRVALPGPALTPYLVGLLVLLGMLGTFLGMVATLRGTGIALESATDLQAIRASLAAPVKGLGFAFGTSVAGVATSAMLGLLSALCRRERILAAQQLDTRIATTLRGHTAAHQRDETFRLLQRQAEAMPVLVDRLQALMTGMEQRNQALSDQLVAGMAAMERQNAVLGERLVAGQAALDQRLAAGQQALDARLGAGQDALAARLGDGHEALGVRLGASQDAFHDKAEAAYARLAASVGETLKESAAESARLAGAALQPVVEATMAGLASETAAWRDAVAQAVQKQHDAITLAAQRQHDAVTRAAERQQETIAQATQRQQDAVADAVQRQLDGLTARFEATTATVGELWNQALTQHQQANRSLTQDLRAMLDRYAETFEQRSAGLMDGVAGRLDIATAGMSQAWSDALSRQEHANAQLARDNQQALAAAASAFERQSLSVLEKMDSRSSSFMGQIEGHFSTAEQGLAQHSSSMLQNLEQHSSSLLRNVEQHSTALLQAIEDSLTQRQAALESRDQQRQADLESRDQQRLEAWTGALDAIAAGLRAQWQETGTQTAARQQEICDTLSRTARDITGQAQAHARDTIAEIERLVQAASEAPKAAADVVAELRQKLSDSMVRDNAMLEERGRLLDTLGTLLDAVNRASTEQREAVDALVATSADLLERIGSQFTDTLQSETVKLAEAAGQVTGSVVEVASMGDAFAAAVQSFGEANEKLTAHLQRIEGALEKSIARSDEQLAYYVAQAREVVDLSVMSQKQIIEDLQQLAEQRASAGSEAA